MQVAQKGWPHDLMTRVVSRSRGLKQIGQSTSSAASNKGDQTRITNYFFANINFFLNESQFFLIHFLRISIFFIRFLWIPNFLKRFQNFLQNWKTHKNPNSDFSSNLERKLICDNEICTFRAPVDTKKPKTRPSTILRLQTGPEMQKHTDHFDVFPVRCDPFDNTNR